MPFPSRASRISREQVFAEALAIIDSEGAEALTMRRLGRACGVQAMSLYHHVSDKSAVVSGVIDLVVGEIDVDGVGEEAPLREVLGRIACSAYEVLLRHPNVVPFLAEWDWVNEAALRISDIMAGAFRRAGYSPTEAAVSLSALNSYVAGTVVATIASRQQYARSGASDQDQRKTETLARIDLSRYPALAWLYQGVDFAQDHDTVATEVFRQGLDILLTGLERRGVATADRPGSAYDHPCGSLRA